MTSSSNSTSYASNLALELSKVLRTPATVSGNEITLSKGRGFALEIAGFDKTGSAYVTDASLNFTIQQEHVKPKPKQKSAASGSHKPGHCVECGDDQTSEHDPDEKVLVLAKIPFVRNDEVRDAVKFLADAGVTITAIHNDWLFDKPRLIVVHFLNVTSNPVGFARVLAPFWRNL